MFCLKNLHPMSSDLCPAAAMFSNTYHKARQRFLDTCAARDLPVQSRIHPDYKDPYGHDLAMDYVWIGPRKARNVLFVTCGTHGLEGAAGAATMVQFIEHGAANALPDDVAVMMVHGVNPYGWAYARRGNEDGIDLNRNCLDHNRPYPQNPAYDGLHDLIKAARVDAQGLSDFTEEFYRFAKVHGQHYTLSGITSGQYNHPDGMSFGGHGLSWSCQTLYDVARHNLGEAQKVITIDWHTGIGDFGLPFFIMDDPVSSDEYRQATSWWTPHKIHSDDILKGGSPAYTGLLIKGLKEKIIDAGPRAVVSVVVEWGTYDLNTMLQALLLDDWLKANAHLKSPQVDEVRTQLIERFYPAASAWRQSVLAYAPPIYQQAINAFHTW